MAAHHVTLKETAYFPEKDKIQPKEMPKKRKQRFVLNMYKIDHIIIIVVMTIF